MKASEVIRETRMQLFRRPWGRGRLYGKRGEVCMRGAMNVAAAGMKGLTFQDEAAALQAIQLAIGGGSIEEWNDDPSRTFDEVIDALDAAEKIAEQREALDA